VPDWKDEGDLELGWLSDRTDEEMEVLWQRHRDYLMAQNAEYHPGLRPYAWWIFDACRDAPGIPEQPDILFAMGAMEEAELAAVRVQWRGHEGSGPKFLRETPCPTP
jgi:hypothetical protein